VTLDSSAIDPIPIAFLSQCRILAETGTFCQVNVAIRSDEFRTRNFPYHPLLRVFCYPKKKKKKKKKTIKKKTINHNNNRNDDDDDDHDNNNAVDSDDGQDDDQDDDDDSK